MKKASGKQKLRPTSQLVKQAIFNMLGDIEGLTFFDIFAGTGQVGLMAQERGAEVIFVEQNPKLASNIRTKIGGKVFAMDALKFLKSTDMLADIIFADPPYSYEKYQELIELSLEKLKEGGIFMLEHSNKRDFGAQRKKFTVIPPYPYGGKEDEEGCLSRHL